MEAEDFAVETKGYCFLCLGRIPPQVSTINLKPIEESQPDLVYSLHCLSRYLKIDMRAVFVEDGPIPPDLLCKVKKSKLKVELCEACISFNDKFSDRFRELERAKMIVANLMEDLLAKMESNKVDAEVNRGMLASLGLGKVQVVEALRKDVEKKCLLKLSNSSSPRVRIQNLTTGQLLAEIRKVQVKRQHSEDAESPCPSPISDNNGNSSGASSSEDSNEPPDLSDNDSDHRRKVSKTRVTPTVAASTSHESSKQDKKPLKDNYLITAKTNKPKCRDCSKEFSSVPAFYHHYRNKHLNFRYRCSACGKQFTQVGSFNRHQRLNHKGAQYKCQVCSQVFNLESNLLKHRQANKCAYKESVEKSGLLVLRLSKRRPKYGTIKNHCTSDPKTGKIKCKLCTKEFGGKNQFRMHYNHVHLKLKYKCTLCDMDFTSRSSYNRHHESFHLPSIYKCPKCPKLFKHRSEFTAHKRRNCETRLKYKCHICNAGFQYKTKLANHQRTSKCRSSIVKFKKPPSSNLKGTLLIIRPSKIPQGDGKPLSIVDPKTGKHRCTLCSKELANSNSFRVHHENVHLKVRYKCTICGSQFKFRQSYQEHHNKVHAGFKLKLQKCKKTYKSRSSLWQHRQKFCKGRDLEVFNLE